MGTKRNYYLDIRSDEDEEGGKTDNSEDLENVRHSKVTTLHSRSIKRQKISQSENSDGASDLNEAEGFGSEAFPFSQPPLEDRQDQHDHAADAEMVLSTVHQAPEMQVPKNQKQKDRKRKTGVLYLSRIPPFMKPPTVRQLLSPHGTITRLFLTPEPQAHYLARKKNHGNKKRSFLDGWVEFSSKKQAKVCAETINGELVGGKKGGWYHDDIWNAKYLKGFKWDDLMEGVRSEERAREERMRVEIRRETRERKAFLESVEQSKKERGMEKKRAEKKKGLPADTTESITITNSSGGYLGEGGEQPQKRGFERHFRQNEVRHAGKGPTSEQPDEVRRVLNKIF